MTNEHLFKWKHYQPDIILLTMRWYLRYNLSFRDLVEMMEERGLSMAHTTIMRWVHQYGPELDKRIRRHLLFCTPPHRPRISTTLFFQRVH